MHRIATCNKKLLAIALAILLIAGGCTPGQEILSTPLSATSIDPTPVVTASPHPEYTEPFSASLKRLGTAFTGQPLSEPYTAKDGMLEQIYENVVVAADPKNLRMIVMRAITAELGFPPTDLVPKRDDDRMVFYPIKPGLGHLVPKVFDEYITDHGGLGYSGMPTTELFQVGDIYRQCFSNYCLDFDLSVPESERIHPAALGSLYLKLHPPTQEAANQIPVTPAGYSLQIWESSAVLSPAAGQSIHLQVMDGQDQNPIPDIEASLAVFLPDGSRGSYHFPRTDSAGQSKLDLPAVDAKNGTLVLYQVCLNVATVTPTCKLDSYVIWNNH